MISWLIKIEKNVISIFVTSFHNGKRVEFDILNHISDYVTFVKLVNTAGNVNHAVSIYTFWVYNSNYKISLPFIK